MKLKQNLMKLQFQIDHLALRERAAILGTILFALFIIWFFFIYKPQKNALTETRAAITMTDAQTITFINKKIMIERLAQDHTVPQLMEKLEGLRAEMKALKQKMTRYEQRYINEREISKVLYAMLKVSKGVTILNFSDASYDFNAAPNAINHDDVINHTVTHLPNEPSPTAIAKSMALVPSAQLNSPNAPIERTEYALTLQGDYFSIMHYLERLEQLDWQLYWAKMEYTVENYPTARAILWFYTLKPVHATPTVTNSTAIKSKGAAT